MEKGDKGTVISFDGDNLQPISTIVKIEVEGSVMDIPPMEIESESLSYNKPVSASSNPDPHWQGISSVNNGDWVGHAWSPAKEDLTPWAEIDLGKPETISKAIVYESGQSVKAFELQCLQGNEWKTVYTGTTIGARSFIEIQPITAQKVRLVLKEFSKVPGIYEIILL
jgi:hypothetical protein